MTSYLRVFVDTEFTDIAPDADLISLGFVTERDERLYIEISDWDRSLASDFVQRVVMPLLGRHNPEVLTRDQAAVRITQWLAELRGGDLTQQIIMLSDSQWDWTQLIELWPWMPGEEVWARQQNVVGRLISNELESGRQQRIFDEELEAFFQMRGHRLTQTGGERHHALVDALANREAFREAHFG